MRKLRLRNICYKVPEWHKWDLSLGPSKISPFSSTIIVPMLINFYALKKKNYI